jgi:hypothetical protein
VLERREALASLNSVNGKVLLYLHKFRPRGRIP